MSKGCHIRYIVRNLRIILKICTHKYIEDCMRRKTWPNNTTDESTNK